MHINNASKILSTNLSDKYQDNEEFRSHLSCIKEAYDADQESFLKVFSCLLKSCENLADFKKLIRF